jgi:paraquat-inducible protein B
MNDAPPETPVPVAEIHPRRRFQMVWLIPLVAIGIALFLGWRTLYQRGPDITLTFSTADGLTAGQTKVRHKAVDLGTVRSIRLSDDRTHVEVVLEMQREATRYLTDHARFWVVRPRLTAGTISGLDTLVSGAYIELDPGAPGGKPLRQFTGLEEPPAVRSDEPGTSFTLKADRVGSLSSGSPVFYRDIPAGEVLGYDLGPNGEGVTIHTFIRRPYDTLVHEGSHFWNASGLSIDLGAGGLALRLESLRAVLSGGVAFDTSAEALQTPQAGTASVFRLYRNEQNAAAAGYTQRIPFLVHFRGSVGGLAVGAPVQIYGIQIGTVTGVRLFFDPAEGARSYVEVRLEIQPERFMANRPDTGESVPDTARRLVRQGLRVELQTANYLTGQLVVSVDFVDHPAPADIGIENGVVVLPSVPGGFDSITANLGRLTSQLSALPLDDIARNLNATLQGVSNLTGGPQITQSLESLQATLATTRDFVKQLNTDVGPALRQTPEIMKSLQASVDRLGKLAGSADQGYGASSQFRRDLERLMGQMSDAARSIRLLADYLDQHPEALVRGRAGQATER